MYFDFNIKILQTSSTNLYQNQLNYQKEIKLMKVVDFIYQLGERTDKSKELRSLKTLKCLFQNASFSFI